MAGRGPSGPDFPELLDLLELLGRGDPWLRTGARCGPVDPASSSPYRVEVEVVARAVPTRQAEFLTGRSLARQALADIGVDAVAIPRRPDRSPDWPRGVLGSITHTAGLCAAVVVQPNAGSDAPAIGIGIDAEVDAELDRAVVERVSTPTERAALGDRLGTDAVVLFAAKEAVFKAINPSTGVWLEPNEVELRLGRDGTIEVEWWAHPVPGLRPAAVRGRWARVGPWVLTGVVAHGSTTTLTPP